MNRLGKHLAIWGTLLQFGLVVGFGVTLYQMARAMSALNPSAPTQPPGIMAAIEISFRTSTVGLILGTIGGLLTLAALFGCRYRAPWFHSVLCLLSIFWLAASPLVGLAVMAYLVLDRKSFTQAAESPFAEPGRE